MDDKRRFTLHCPTCRSRIVVDAETGKVLFHEKARSGEPPAEEKSIQDLMREMEEKRRKAEERFREEQEALKNRSRYLEKKFEEMKKQVDTSDGAPPPHPFDYD